MAKEEVHPSTLFSVSLLRLFEGVVAGVSFCLAMLTYVCLRCSWYIVLLQDSRGFYDRVGQQLPFTGRQEEMAELRKALDKNVRLWQSLQAKQSDPTASALVRDEYK